MGYNPEGHKESDMPEVTQHRKQDWGTHPEWTGSLVQSSGRFVLPGWWARGKKREQKTELYWDSVLQNQLIRHSKL